MIRHAVTKRLRDGKSFANPDLADFELGPAEPVDALPANVAPWGLHTASGSVVVLDFTDADALIRAPFAYQEQAAQATGVYLVPYSAFAWGGRPRPPIFLHSVGRCGSTHLAQRLSRIPGLRGLSEPGVYCAIQSAVEEGALDEATATDLIRASTASLSRAFAGDDTLVIKTRSADCRVWPLFDAAHPDARSLFLYRDAARVVQSFDRILGYPHGRSQVLADRDAIFERQLPNYEKALRTRFFARSSPGFEIARRECGPWAGLLLTELIDKISAYLAARARDPDRVHGLRYEDLVEREEAVMDGVAAFLGREWPRGVAPAEADSQEGTPLAAVPTLAHPLDAATLAGIACAGQALLGSQFTSL